MKRIMRVLPPRTAKLPRKRGKGKRAGAQLQNELLPLVTGALGQIRARALERDRGSRELRVVFKHGRAACFSGKEEFLDNLRHFLLK
jgi:hypothetical protein